MIVCLIFNHLIIIVAFFYPNEPTPLIFATTANAGLGFSGQWIFTWIMLPDVIAYDQVMTGKRHEGIYYGMWSFLGRFTVALGIAVSFWALSLSGYMDYQPPQDERTLLGIRLIFSPVPAAILSLSLL